MRLILSIVLMLLVKSLVLGQSSVQFDIEVLYAHDSSETKTVSDFEPIDTAFFQDAHYFVRRTCMGEFGGSVWFRNKETGIEYSCAATCPVMVNKIDNKYVVTTSLTHFQSSSSLLEIESPDSMEVFQELELERAVGKLGFKKRRWSRWGFRKVYYAHSAGDLQSKSRKGTNSILDTIGVNILLSFPYQEHLFHVVNDSRTLYLSESQGGTLTTIDTIYTGLNKFDIVENGVRYGYNTDAFKTKENGYVVLFKNSGLMGYLVINENNIRLTRYK